MAFNSKEEETYQGDERTLLKILGDSAVLDGKFKISQAIDIDCELKGKLTVDGKLTILQNGRVNADVKTIEAEIIGKYEGNMEATGNVEIKETGIVIGNVKTDSLIINQGGVFSGNVSRMTEGPVVQRKNGSAEKMQEDQEEVSGEIQGDESEEKDKYELYSYNQDSSEQEEDSLNL
jgi:cytoskeletal protein CcmA (bactofilin family)